MSKIKIICDSTCDMEKEMASKLNVSILPLTVIIEGKEYKDGIDFKKDEFYDILDKCKELPSTSQVTPEQFLNEFEDAYTKGYESVITINLNSLASGTYQSAVIAKGFFEEKHADVMRIEVIDSGTYTQLISAGVYEAINLINSNKTVDEIVIFLNNFYKKIKAIAAVGTLEILIKKGRISSFSGLIGGILNIKPILKLWNAEIVSFDKVRGNSAVVPKLLEYCENEMDNNSDFLITICCRECPEHIELIEKLKAKYPNKKIITGYLGSVLASNIGTYVVGLGYISK